MCSSQLSATRDTIAVCVLVTASKRGALRLSAAQETSELVVILIDLSHLKL